VVTGNPVRPEILAVTRVPETVHVLGIVGGSLGARSLNDAGLDLYTRWRDRADVSIRHVSGARDHERCRRRLDELARPDDRLAYELVEYEDDMPGLYARASVIVARAGASTVAELTAVGVPSVLVPLPGSPGAHQERNASTLAGRGAAVVVADRDCSGPRLDVELTALLSDPGRLAAMGAAARSIARRDAGECLADLVEEHARAR
jgi:UDP-N-acetylglucosamine--N-acetylmuramyl-(pentapeptide) pyrophosphoryl-undecaprenol N-acetylglucosamine transferase